MGWSGTVETGRARRCRNHRHPVHAPGSLKEAGLLVLLNRHISARWEKRLKLTSVRTAPRDHEGLLELARTRIPPERMPLLVGVGDTVTSGLRTDRAGWGQRPRLLTLLQELGPWSGQNNRVILVDSSHGEVDVRALRMGS